MGVEEGGNPVPPAPARALPTGVHVVFVDAWDSFTHNLVAGLREAGADVDVVPCDAPTDAILGLRPDALVLGPGPGHPDDAGGFLALVRRAIASDLPLLGVCLGHQALGRALGARIVRHPPVHGHAAPVAHDGTGVFAGLPPVPAMTRYHSLGVEAASLPQSLRVTARADGVVMGLAHARGLAHGVQFHPESVLSGAAGQRLLANFVALAAAARAPARAALG